MNETTNNETNELPSELSYSNDDLARAAARKQYREGWYALYCQRNIKEQGTSKAYRFTQDYVPLRNPDDTDTRGTLKIKNFVTLPFTVEGSEKYSKEPPNTFRVCHTMLRAFGGKFSEGLLDYPTREDGVTTFNGRELGKGEWDAAEAEVKASIRACIAAIFKDPSAMQGHIVYAYLKPRGEYVDIKVMKAELPEGETLVEPSEWFTTDPTDA